MSRYRPNSHARRDRSARTNVDHDIFAGLPVRQWRKTSLTVGVPPQQQSASSRALQPELPLPKEAHLLSPMSLALLQAARAGVLNKPPPSKDTEEDPKEEEEKADNTGFLSIKWSGVPRHLEEPEVEFLAKKRKIYDPKAIAAEAERERLRLARLAALNAPPGSTVAGELMAADGIGLAGMAVDGQFIVDPQPRRKAPPIRKKTKYAGRGRKKKVQFTPVAEGAAVEGVAAVPLAEGEVAPAPAPVDTEMTEDNDHEEGEEEDDEDEEGEEGSEDEDGETEQAGDSAKPESSQEASLPPDLAVVPLEVLKDTVMTDAPSDEPPAAPVPAPATLPQQVASEVPQDSDWEIVDAAEAIPESLPPVEAVLVAEPPTAMEESVPTIPSAAPLLTDPLPPPVPLELLSAPPAPELMVTDEPVPVALPPIIEPAIVVAEAPPVAAPEEHAVPISDLLQTPTPQPQTAVSPVPDVPPPAPHPEAAVPALPVEKIAEMLAAPQPMLPAEEMAPLSEVISAPVEEPVNVIEPIQRIVSPVSPPAIESLPSIETVTAPVDAAPVSSEMLPPAEEVKVDALLNPAPEPVPEPVPEPAAETERVVPDPAPALTTDAEPVPEPGPEAEKKE